MKKLISSILTILVIAPILATIINLPVAVAQFEPVKIREIYVLGQRVTDIGGVYPGLPVIVEVEVGLAVPFYIVVRDNTTGYIYVRQYVPSPTTGRINYTVEIPRLLPGLTVDPMVSPFAMVNFIVEPTFGQPHYYPHIVYIYPRIEVEPKALTLVDELGTPRTTTFTVYGVPLNNELQFIYIGPAHAVGTCTIAVYQSPDTNGVVRVTLSILDKCGPIAGGDYPVQFKLLRDDMSKHMNDTISILPIVIFVNREGHGMWVDLPLIEPDGTIRPARDNITLIGYGLRANTFITNIRLINLNFTQFNVHYNVPTSIFVPSHGHIVVTELPVNSNMTAGLYIPEITYHDGVRVEFRYSYYLVRPVLLFLYGEGLYREYPAILQPGDTITIVAFGYGPGAKWTGTASKLVAYFDDIVVTVVDILHDGNATFPYTIPMDATYGSHYVRGIDEPWKYEYSIAVVVGGKAIFVVVSPIGMVDKKVYQAVPSYNNRQVIICPCEELIGTSYCGVCVRYGGDCDYLGDYINITIYGLAPGERLLEIRLGEHVVPRALWYPTEPAADSTGKLTVRILVPTLIEGTYTVIVRTEYQGTIVVSWMHNPRITYVEVVSKILLLPLHTDDYIPVLVGSGAVRVIGVGFRPGAVFYKVLVNNTDAIVPVTTQVGTWRVNERGIIVGERIGDLEVTPGLWIPFVEPGKYSISLAYYVGTELRLSTAGFVFVVNNLSRVLTKDDTVGLAGSVAESLRSELQAIQNALISIDGKVAKIDTVITSLGDIQTRLQQLGDIVARLDTIRRDLADASASISAAATKIDAVSTRVNEIATRVTAIETGVATVSSKVDNVSSKVDGITATVTGLGTTLYVGILATIFALLATIFSLLAYMTIKKSVAPK